MRRNTAFRGAVAATGAIALVAAIAGCSTNGGTGSNGDDKAPIVIGYNDDMSGPISFAGLTNLAGVETYFDYVNEEKGGINGHPVELVALDTRADGATSIANFKELVEDHGAIAVLGNSASGAWAATAPLAGEYEVPQLGYGNADDYFATYTPYMFKTGMTQDQQGELIAQVAEDYLFEGKSDDLKIAIYAMETASGPIFIESIEEIAADRGWEIVQVQTAAVGATDCTAQAAQVAAANPDVVFGNITSVGEDIVCFQQLQTRGYDGPWVNTNSSAAEGTYSTLATDKWISIRPFSWWEDDSVDGVADLFERADKYGHASQLGAYSADGYIAAMILEAALLECGEDCTGPELQKALESLNGVDTKGIAGPLLGFTDGDYGHTVPQARAFVWDAAAGRSVPLTDWLTLSGRG